MKQISHVLLIFLSLFLILSHSPTSARILPPNQGDQQVKANEIIQTKEDSLFNLMGLEECNDKDEECLKRRMVAEAHLDYIYTQHQKP